MPSRKLDPIKKGLAVAIQHHFLTGPDRPPKVLPVPMNVESVEGSIISPTETQIRVKTTNEGTRYFTIKLTEHI